jgi:hypothetical protein
MSNHSYIILDWKRVQGLSAQMHLGLTLVRPFVPHVYMAVCVHTVCKLIHSSVLVFGTLQWCMFGGGISTNAVEDSEQREWGSGGGSPLIRGSAQFANE